MADSPRRQRPALHAALLAERLVPIRDLGGLQLLEHDVAEVRVDLLVSELAVALRRLEGEAGRGMASLPGSGAGPSQASTYSRTVVLLGSGRVPASAWDSRRVNSFSASCRRP
jgi:hypothetical protein